MVNSVSAGQTIVMNGDDTLVIGAPGAFAGTIEAMVGDSIVLAGTTVTSAVDTNGTLMVFSGTQNVASLVLAGNYATDHFTATGSTVAVAAGAEGLSITGAVAGQAVADTATLAPFANVVLADPNIGQTETLTVTLTATANGTLGNLGGGSYNAVTGVYTDVGSLAAVATDLDGLVFTPTAHQAAAGQVVTTGFAIALTDSGLATVANNTTSVIATESSVTDPVAPTIAGTFAGQAVTDHATIAPFAGVVIGDAGAGQTETLTVTLSAAANGGLSNLGAGSYNATTGVYTDTGSAAAVTTDIDGLVFTPTAGEVAQGQTVTTGFTISDTNTATGTATDTTTSVIASASNPQLSVTDTTTGLTLPAALTAYSGPVAGLQWEFISVTTDNLNITATSPNSFIHTGSGTDAIDVSHVNGNNVLDGGTGSNFLVGGTGSDTFFVDDRGPSADIWSTVANFHSGDAATIWGVTPTDFSLNWVNGQGATGYTGLTLHATGAGVPTASLTLSGFSTADLTDGKLTVSFGTTAASGGVAGSTYMYVHAN